MPVLAEIRKRMVKEQTFEGMKVGMALHTEAKTAVLALTIQEAGAEVHSYRGEEISLPGCGGPTCLTRPILRGDLR